MIYFSPLGATMSFQIISTSQCFLLFLNIKQLLKKLNNFLKINCQCLVIWIELVTFNAKIIYALFTAIFVRVILGIDPAVVINAAGDVAAALIAVALQ